MPGKSRSRSPGKKFPSKYEQDVEERREFRMRMKAELKLLAKDSFMEELERMKQIHPLAAKMSNNNSYDALENERQQNLEMEVQRLNQMVEDMRYGGMSGAAPMQVEWSSPFAQNQGLPIVSPGKQMTTGGGLSSWNNSLSVGNRFEDSQLFNGSRFESINATPYVGNKVGSSFEPNQSRTFNHSTNNNFNQQLSQQTNQVNNNMFVLSCAPINGFNKLLHQDDNIPQLSLVEQAHRFAEMQALFQVPSHLPAHDPFHQQQQQYEREQQAERQRRLDSMRQQREKLQSSIESHKDRLEKGRTTPQRFPMDAKPSMQSPRAKIQQRQPQQLQQPSYDTLIGPMMDTVPPSSAMQSTPHPLTTHSVDSMLTSSIAPGSALEGNTTTGPLSGSPIATNPATTTPNSSPKRPKTITFEEFEQKTDKINEDLKKLVREVVHEEMIADGQAQHYTRRFQNKLLATKQETLVSKIEKAVAEKIQLLQKEIEDLKEQKVKNKKKRNALRDSLDANDEGGWGDLLGGDGVDGKVLSAEINRSVEMALKRLLGAEGGSPERSTGTASTKRGIDEERLGSTREKPISTRVHGRISAAPPDSAASDANKDAVGFEEPPALFLSQPSLTLSQTSMELPSQIDAPTPFEEPPVVKPKSKADRLLGISTDPKSGLPVHDNLTSTKQNGLFGSIGSLFSSKPGSSASPSGGGMVTGFGASSRNTPSMTTHSPMVKPHALGTIVDDGSHDDQSDKKSGGSLKKGRRANKDSSLRESFGVSESTKSGAASAYSGGAGSNNTANTNVNVTPAPPPMNPQLVAEIATEEVNYRTLMSNLLSLADVKVNIKKELKDWQSDFQAKFGREATVEDKMAINDRFIAYKMVCTQVQEAKDLVKASESKLKELRDKAANPQ